TVYIASTSQYSREASMYGPLPDTLAFKVAYMIHTFENSPPSPQNFNPAIPDLPLALNSQIANCVPPPKKVVLVPKVDLGGIWNQVPPAYRWDNQFMQQDVRNFLDRANSGLTDRYPRLSRNSTTGAIMRQKNSLAIDRVPGYALRLNDILL